MKQLKTHLKILQKVKREEYHPLLHKLHIKHKISKKTLLYIKEYGPKSHVFSVIFKESIAVVLFAGLCSAIGGLALESIRPIFISLMPLIILFPVLNDMIGDYGIIISSRFTTLLHMGKVDGKWYKHKFLLRLFFQILIIALITGLVSTFIALVISIQQNFNVTSAIVYKLFLTCVIDVMLLVIILFLIAIYGGYYYFKKNEDPDNFLIPITTALADFGNMMILAVLVRLFF
jgi:cation transporter-like permease